MLIEFSVSNFKSIKDTQTLSLVKGQGDELIKSNSFTFNNDYEQIELLRSAAIYGPNASGKSNLLIALKTMQNIVLGSYSMRPNEKLKVVPFKLSKEMIDKPTTFEIHFIHDKVRYEYGFSLTTDKIIDEWLFAYPKGRTQKWYERKWNDVEQKYNWEFGKSLQGKKQTWLSSTRDNALFLSTAVQLNSTQLTVVFKWFSSQIKPTSQQDLNQYWQSNFTAKLAQHESDAITTFMQIADFNIHGIAAEPVDIEKMNFPDGVPTELQSYIRSATQNNPSFDITMFHKDSDGDMVPFDIEEESAGTKRFFSYAGPWLTALIRGYTLFIDEIHENLHPTLVRHLVRLFNNSDTNINNAQLIFTTHETSLLDQDVLRRDQVWFFEKGKEQDSLLYPLTDFHPRKGKENLEASYLVGRYGALPTIWDLPKGFINGNKETQTH